MYGALAKALSLGSGWKALNRGDQNLILSGGEDAIFHNYDTGFRSESDAPESQ